MMVVVVVVMVDLVVCSVTGLSFWLSGGPGGGGGVLGGGGGGQFEVVSHGKNEFFMQRILGTQNDGGTVKCEYQYQF
ncbi:hypothetical protein Pint_15571 [Pistacia integerrima]|uniref:Uncharacterized protein n=1 Tax=Pistacia integerrima TaxID=434235 RepID=A0ACC0ZCZ0_9ROSI|nr:hypothetical protein Pint_15571 [Pistacia integerrima]